MVHMLLLEGRSIMDNVSGNFMFWAAICVWAILAVLLSIKSDSMKGKTALIIVTVIAFIFLFPSLIALFFYQQCSGCPG